jgi:ATP-dependent Clp protease adaptor protein ClpS
MNLMIKSNMLPGTETDVLVETEEQVEAQRAIILFNDDFNTFDFVIETLVELCDHEPIQAEQCAHLVHYKGKCSVKAGSYDKLKPVCSALLERGLTAEIE